MILESLTSQTFFSFVVLPFLIFLARITDVTIGTMRIVFVSKGHKILAPILGFFEVFIWVVVIGQIMQNAHSWIYYIAYAAGFAMGNYFGLLLEERLALGKQLIRIITSKGGNTLLKNLNMAGFGATSIVARGSSGRVNIVYTIVQRENIQEALQIIHDFSDRAFYTIEDIREINAGIFPAHKKTIESIQLFRPWRKGK